MATAVAEHTGPTYPDLRRAIAQLMLTRGEWAGMPVPVAGLSLHVEPTYPHAEFLNKHVPDPDEPGRDDSLGLDENGLGPGESMVNSWYSRVRQAHVFLVREANGRVQHYLLPQSPQMRRLDISLKGYHAAIAHDLEAEGTAMAALWSHLNAVQIRQYCLLGEFLETSKASGVTYVFRRTRPTIALRPALGGRNMRVMAVLCMHPIGYYRETTIGAMTPSDDVLARLLLMRGDEAMYWRRCNQHSPEDPEAML